jgi:hypothetical protein
MGWLRRNADFGEDGPIIEANAMIDELLAKYPHDAVIAAIFASMKARCRSAETFMDVAECAGAAFGPSYLALKQQHPSLTN